MSDLKFEQKIAYKMHYCDGCKKTIYPYDSPGSQNSEHTVGEYMQGGYWDDGARKYVQEKYHMECYPY